MPNGSVFQKWQMFGEMFLYPKVGVYTVVQVSDLNYGSTVENQTSKSFFKDLTINAIVVT